MILHGPHGAREVPAGEFFVGPGETALQVGDLVTAIRYPVPPAGAAGRYLKLGRSQVGDLAIVSAAVFGFPDGMAPSGYRFHIALGSVAPVVVRVADAESLLAESPPGEQTFALAAEKAVSAAQPIDDVRASAAYRREMVRALTLRGLRAVWGELG
jgi:CO/xanthine dehydrogenase FAD-binding subunit